jgi:hypothetical protein
MPEIRRTFEQLFPTLLGVNLSHHLPPEVMACVYKCLKEHASKNSARKAAIIKRLTHQLRTDQKTRTRKYVKHFLEEQLALLEVGVRSVSPQI